MRVSATLVNDGQNPGRSASKRASRTTPQAIVASESRVSASPGRPLRLDTTLAHRPPAAVARHAGSLPVPARHDGAVDARADLDQVIQPLGLRSSVRCGQGFFLNGEHLFLKGASMHQDRPVKGWAISHADQAEDFDLLRDLGGECGAPGALSTRSIFLRVGGRAGDRGVGGNSAGEQSVIRRLARECRAGRQRPAAAHRADSSKLQPSVDRGMVDCQ